MADVGTRGRWWITGIVAAAVVGVVVSFALRPGPPGPTGPIGEDRGFTWSRTANPPLSPRHGAMAVWESGHYYLFGGWSGEPCRPGATCEPGAPDLRDGARYDPVADTWAPIATAPDGFGVGVTRLATPWGLYLTNASGEGPLWRYLPDDDTWQELPAAPVAGDLTTSSINPTVIAGDGTPVGYELGVYAEGWVGLRPGPLDLCRDRQGMPSGDYRVVVVADCGSDPATGGQVSLWDSYTGEWSSPVALGAAVGGPAVYTGGRLVWPGLAGADGEGFGSFDLGARAWRPVPDPGPAGPLAFRGTADTAPPLVLGDPTLAARPGLLAVNGRLLDLVGATWVSVPAPPVADRWQPVRAAGPGQLLDCFGYAYTSQDNASGAYTEGCHLLAVPEAPSPAPGPPTVADLDSEWTLVGKPTSVGGTEVEVTTRPGLVEVGGRFFLLGGAYREGDAESPLPTRRFDPASGAWEERAAPERSPNGTVVVGAVAEVVYLNLAFDDVWQLWAYDTAADQWRWTANSNPATQRFLATEDAVVRFEVDDLGRVNRPPRLWDGTRWTALPEPPVVSYRGSDVHRLGDHLIGVESGGRVFTLDTAARTWDGGSEPREVTGRDAFGLADTAVFVTPLMREDIIDPEYTARLDVLTYRGGAWSHPAPLRRRGGLGAVTGAAGGGRLVVNGNLFDPVTGGWLTVPELTGPDGVHDAGFLAVGEAGVLNCLPSLGEIPLPGCYFLPIPE